MDRAGKLTEREILAVWTTGERDHAGISTFRTTSERPGVHDRTTFERPGVHKNVAGHMILRTMRGMKLASDCAAAARIFLFAAAAI